MHNSGEERKQKRKRKKKIGYIVRGEIFRGFRCSPRQETSPVKREGKKSDEPAVEIVQICLIKIRTRFREFFAVDDIFA